MLRELLRHSSRQPAVVPGDSLVMVSAAAEAEGGAGAAGFLAPAVPVAALSSAEQASSLITSCARKQAEKRRAEAAQQGAALVPLHKRSRGAAQGDAAAQLAPDQDQHQHQQHVQQLQDDGSTSDVSIDDQENLQHATQYQRLPAAPQQTVVRAACSTLGHMLAPFVGWMPATHGHHHQQQQQLQQQQVGSAVAAAGAVAGPACAQEDALAWSDETVACSEEGLNNSSPASSSGAAPTVSQQPSTAGNSLQSHPYHQQQTHGAQQQQHEQDQATLQPQQATCSVEGTAVTSAGNTAEDSDDVEYDDEDFCPYTFISSLGPVERYVEPGRQPLLPRQTRACKQKTLVLDLDETLVHSTLEPGYGAGADFSFPVLFNGSEHMVHVRIRPHMQAFLERVAELYEVVVFTASQKVYAEKLLNILDPTRTLIRHRIYRDSCVVVDGNYLKDLSVLGRDLCRCAIVDNSPQAFGFQLSNGIPIESWYDDPTDNELPALLPFLEALAAAEVPDVRPAISAKFNLEHRVAEANQRLAAAAAAAMRQHQLQEQQEQQELEPQHTEEQHAAALMAHVAVAGVLQSHQEQHPMPGMMQMMLQQTHSHAQEQAA